MSYATAAPGQSTAPGTAPPICQNCSTSTTPLWRRDESGSVLCNACGLFLKLHGRPRPISLKTDVIKSRNRVKTGQNGQKKNTGQRQGLPAAHPDAASSPLPHGSGARTASMSRVQISDADDHHDLSHSRPSTPSGMHAMAHPGAGNIAPQHMFDGVTLDSNGPQSLNNNFVSPSPYYAAAPARHGSPNSTSMHNNGVGVGSHMDGQPQSNTSLKTRVSELEVINELFRGRVNELENSEADLRRQLDEAAAREQELRRRIEELEAATIISTSNEDGYERQMKRLRTSDYINEDVVEPVPLAEAPTTLEQRAVTGDAAAP